MSKLKSKSQILNLKQNLETTKHIPSEIEKKWQKVWAEKKVYSPNLDSAKKPFYNLMMFPYPSAQGMHVGNMYAFTGADVYGRFKRMQGFDVFEPIGLDGFGIHSENYAIKIGRHPKEQARISQENFYRQLRATGNGFDWSRRLETYDPLYYKWTQWLFIQLFKAGLAYRKKAPVNFCPSCKTVLADEQVVKGQKNVGKTRHDVYGKENVILGRRAATTPESLRTLHDRGDSGRASPRTVWCRASLARMTNGDISIDESQVCERCETKVVKKDLEQWFLKITKYANRLLANIAKLNWSEKVKIAQKQWIGKSEGAIITFPVIASRSEAISDFKGIATDSSSLRNDKLSIEVFTTRPDTLYGATFLVLSPENPLVNVILNSFQDLKIPKQVRDDIEKYVQQAKTKTEHERMAEGKEKTGVFTGLYAINPVNKEKIQIWIADYVLMGYGTGAIMGVPAHDQRDLEFAKKYNLPIRNVIASEAKQSQTNQEIASSQAPRNDNFEKVYEEEGKITNSGEWNGWRVPEGIGKVIDWLDKKGKGKRKVTYHLRDWLISRQRYWGPPIPMIYCETCAAKRISCSSSEERSDESRSTKKDSSRLTPLSGVRSNDNTSMTGMFGWFPVSEKDLPVLLPDVKDWKPTGTGKSPLANVESFVNTNCPNCKGPAKRETDVSDTFLDSSWYFLRYVSTDIDSVAFDIKRVKKWLPVKMYIGGAEHSVLHLLYSRFITMVLHNLGFISFEEPFSHFFAHGLLTKQGSKMSKSKGNVVVPDEYIKKYGADTLRMYLMFLGPFNQGGDFYDTGIEGMNKFLKRVWTLICNSEFISESKSSRDETPNQAQPDRNDTARKRVMYRTIKKVTDNISSLKYNTAIAALMEWHNYLKSKITKEEIETFLKLLAPFAPHMTEELYQNVILSEAKDPMNKERDSSSRQVGTQNDKGWSIHLQPWPKYDTKFLEEREVTIVVQVDGKVRDTMIVQSSKLKVQSYVEQLVRESDKVKKHLKAKSVRKVVYVEGKVINFVTND